MARRATGVNPLCRRQGKGKGKGEGEGKGKGKYGRGQGDGRGGVAATLGERDFLGRWQGEGEVGVQGEDENGVGDADGVVDENEVGDADGVVDENEVVDADGVRRCGRALLLLVGVLLPACASSGQGAADWRAAQPERPTVATHAYAVAPGVVEVEAGVQALHPAGGAETDAPVVMKFGAAPRLQVELQGGWTRKRAGVPAGAPPGPAPGALSGLTDLAIAPKLQLLDGAPILANFSIQPSLKLPTGSADKGTGTGTTDVGLLLISSRSGGPFSLDLNAGVTRRDGDGSNAPRTATFLTASGGVSLSSGLGWVLECFSFPGTSGPAGARTQVGLLSGPTWAVRPWLVLDAGAIGNIAGLPATSIYAGLTWNIGRLRDWPSGRRAVRSRP